MRAAPPVAALRDGGAGAAPVVGPISGTPGGIDVVDITVAAGVPAPAALALLAADVAGVGTLRRRPAECGLPPPPSPRGASIATRLRAAAASR